MKNQEQHHSAHALLGTENLLIVSFALAYFLALDVALLCRAQNVAATIWPAGGVGLAAFLLTPRRRWPVVMLGLFIAGLSARLLWSRPIVTSLGFMAVHLLESLAAATLISLWCGTRVRFFRVKEVIALIVAASAVNACTALLGAAAAATTPGTQFWTAWLTWWIADGLGMLLLGSLIVTWADLGRGFSGFDRNRIGESVLFLAAWCAVVWWVFQARVTPFPLPPYALFGLLVWCALRFGPRGVTVALLVGAVIAFTSQAVSTGPFLWGGNDFMARLSAVQMYFAFAGATTLLLAASYTETRTAERSYRESLSSLQALGDNLPNGIVFQLAQEPDGTKRFLYLSSRIEQLTGVTAEEALRDANSIYNLIVPEDRQSFHEAEADAVRNLHVFDLACRMERRGGGFRWIHVSTKPRLLPSGRIVGDGILIDITKQRQAEHDLRSSEQERRNILETAIDGFWLLDLQGRLLEVNDSYCRMSGYTAAALLTMSISHLDPVEQPAETAARLKQIVDTGEARFEARHRRKDGSIFDVEVIAQYRSNAGGHIVSFLRDITARKEAEEALRRSEERVRLKLANILSPHETLGNLELEDIIDTQAVQALMTDFHRLTGLPVSIVDRHGRTLVQTGRQVVCSEFHLLHPESARNCEESITGCAQGVAPGTYKTYLCRNNLWAAVTPITIAGEHAGNLFAGQFFFEGEHPARELFCEQARRFRFDQAGYLAAVDRVPRFTRDQIGMVMSFYLKFAEMISALSHGNLKLAKSAQALRESELRFSRLAEQSGTVTWEMDAEGRYTKVSAVSEAVMKYRPEELAGRPHFELHPEDGREAFRQTIVRLFETREPVRNLEHPVLAGDGSVISVSTHGMPLLDADGNLLGYCGTHMDLSERKRAEAEKENLQAQLAQAHKMESVGRLAGGVAHDFNNLLTVINGYSGFLAKELPAHDPLREYALEIGKAGTRAAGLTNQLLAFSRKQLIRPRLINLNDVVAEAGHMLRRLIGEDIQMETTLDPSLGQAMADPDQIHQVLMNLAVNARDAMPDGGLLEISTLEVELDREGAAAHPDAAPGRFVAIRVKDNGAGMTGEVRQRIFEPFFTTKEQGKGTGLGLATVYGISRQNNGWIEVQSEPGRGSAFLVYLPRAGDTSPAAEPPAAPKDKLRGSETVLVVEDQQAVRRLAIAILKSHGYNAIEASDSLHALAVAAGHSGPIDLLLTDVVMPGGDGHALSRQLRQVRPDLKVLLMSGYSEDVIAHRGVLSEGLAYLHKPFAPDELAARIREVLGA